MEVVELIENTLRRKHLEEMINRPSSPQKLLNWTDKGAMQLNLKFALKKITLQEGTNSLPFYMYLDNKLKDVVHLWCLAHTRAKFKYHTTRDT